MSYQTSAAPVAETIVYAWEEPNHVLAARYGLAPEDVVRFDLNTSPATPAFLPELLPGPYDPTLNEYPDCTYADLAEAAGGYAGVDDSEILVGAGADEVIDTIAKSFLQPGSGSLVPIPTYSLYAVVASQRGARPMPVLRRSAADGFALDMPTMLERLPEAAVVWLCSPNNPTGAPEAAADVEAILEAGASLPGGGPAIVMDEAYHEFHPGSLVRLRTRYPSLIVIRTISKAFALPGLRVGYAVAARPTIARLERVRPPGSISTVSATIAAEALRRPEVAVANARALIAERDWLAARLAGIGLPAYPSVTNFLLVHIGDQDAADAAEEHLLRHGIVPRAFGPGHPLRGHLRFTVRDRAQDQRLLEVLEARSDERSS
ncbi:MAG TPA: histidinol-phosphate transaminase [Candidatus Limnocylindrales bacterium]|nr:histidinol-phosphate transaminase [Candidatus Limnocylindrales bacterium]